MVRYGEVYPGDVEKLVLTNVNIEGIEQEFEQTDSLFAATLIRELSNDQKLTAKSFENMKAGFKLKVGTKPLQGHAEPIEQENEICCETIQKETWIKWETYAEKAKKQQTVTLKTLSSKISTVKTSKLKLNSDPMLLRRKIRQSSDKSKQIVVQQRASKASYRRTSDGFNRYIRTLDSTVNTNMNHLIDLLN